MVPDCASTSAALYPKWPQNFLNATYSAKLNENWLTNN